MYSGLTECLILMTVAFGTQWLGKAERGQRDVSLV